MYVWMYVCMCVCDVCMYVCMCVCVCVYGTRCNTIAWYCPCIHIHHIYSIALFLLDTGNVQPALQQPRYMLYFYRWSAGVLYWLCCVELCV